MPDTPEFNYDEIAEAYAAGVDKAPHNAYYERPATLSLIPEVAEAHVFDAGCGSGFYTEELARRGAMVTAMDGSERMAAHARQRLGDAGLIAGTKPSPGTATVRTGDLGQPLTFLPDASVDGILSALVMHYLRDWDPTLREFRRVLRPGGWLLISTHHPATEATRFDIPNYFVTEPIEDHWSWVGNVRFFRRPLSRIVGAITDSGFVIDRLVEPMPTDEFREVDPESCALLLKHPEFLILRARPREQGQ